jgi:hypothetical protein
MKRFLRYTIAALAAVALTLRAHALPKLMISDGVNAAVTVEDNSLADANAALGVVTWVGTVGAWTINVDTGLTKPVQGSAANPYLDLSFIDGSAAAGTLTLAFSDTDFGPGFGTAVAQIGGTATGTVAYATYWDPANVQFALTHLLTSQGPFGPGPYSGDVVGGTVSSPTGPYSLTQVITIAHRGAGVSSGNADLRVADSGMSVTLLGAGIIALALFGRVRGRLV